MASRHRLAAIAAIFVLLGTSLTATASAQVCECRFPESNDNGKVAGAFGGGMFTGLVAAVLHIKHQREAVGQPRVISANLDPAVSDTAPVSPIVVAAVAPAPADAPESFRREGDLRGPVAPSRPAHPEPMLSARDAKREGWVPPKTATYYPALAMIGVGSLILGLFLLRERSGRRRVR
ncbi:MAG TPA: hypothetical protein VF041_12125 [Gemmatimonadaceae bacterium]